MVEKLQLVEGDVEKGLFLLSALVLSGRQMVFRLMMKQSFRLPHTRLPLLRISTIEA